jgi:Lon protease (S16) C-terminal proteolytic domain
MKFSTQIRLSLLSYLFIAICLQSAICQVLPDKYFGPWKLGMTLAEAKQSDVRLIVDETPGASHGLFNTFMTSRKFTWYNVAWQIKYLFYNDILINIQIESEIAESEAQLQRIAKSAFEGIRQEIGLPVDEALIAPLRVAVQAGYSGKSVPAFSVPGDTRFRVVFRQGVDDKNGIGPTLHLVLTRSDKDFPLPLGSPSPAPTPNSVPLTSSPEESTSDSSWTLELPGSKDAVFKRSLSSINALLVSPLEGAVNASTAMKLSATAIGGTAPDSIKFSFNQAVGEDMQKASDEVVRAVQVRHGQYPANMDVKFGFGDKWGGKDGPSAAVACALLLESLIGGFDIPSNFACTGDLNADSTVQPVGGVADKVRGAMDLKCDLIGVPIGNEEDLMDLVVEENLRRFLSAKVFTLRQLDDAVVLANPTSQSEGQKTALTDLAALQAELTSGGAAALYAPATAQRLDSILSAFPNSFTAKILKSATQRKIPSSYSLSGTCVRIEGAMAPFENSIQEIRGGADITNYQLGRDNPLQAAKNNLAALKAKSDPRLMRVIDAEMALIDQFQRLLNANLKSSTVAGNYLAELRAAGERSDAEWQKLRDDKEIQDQLMQRGISL